MNQLDKYFIYKCEKGLVERGLSDKPEYVERLKFELDTITRMEFSGYFLIVSDFINWAKRNNIYVGPGRGSAAGCLASYCLRVTNLDPIRWKLLFERFLNPDRISMPDIDVDFENRRRDQVIDYVAQRYGEDHVAHIGTFGTMKAKSAVKDVCRVLGEPILMGEKLSKLLLAPVHGKPQPLKTSFEKVAELSKAYNSDTREGTVLRWAEKIENLKKSMGVHACGIVIGNESIHDKIPLFKGRGGEITTQLEMNNIEDLGFIKFDFLGVEALDKMHACVDIVKERHNIDIDMENIPLDDELVFSNLRAGDAVGIFQLEASAGMKDLLVQIRPTSVEDLIALVAIYRPGPLGSTYKDTYLNVRAGNQEPDYLVPELAPILERTGGWLIYQEQIMEIAKTLANYTGGEADELRKAVGKKKEKLMNKHEPKFKKGWVEHGLPAKAADQLWDDMVSFAAYGFNRSHAAAYAFITYQTAYLKAHYPTEFLCAVMLCVGKKKKDHLIRCLTECKRLGIKVSPPDINESKDSFSVTDDKQIRFGLGPIKHVGAAAAVILEERKKAGPFTSLRNFCERVDMGVVNRGKLEALIKAGCFDRFGQNRATMLGAVERIWQHRDEMKKYDKKMQTYEKKEEKRLERLREIEEEASKKKPLKPWPKPEEPQWPEIVEMDELSDSDIHTMEHELLGFFVSSHPLDKVSQSVLSDSFNTIDDMQDMGNDQPVSFAGVITNLREITTKTKKQKMAFALIEDLTGSVEVTIFSAVYNKVSHLLDEKRPLLIEGNLDITEADEGDKTVKVRVKNITLLDLNTTSSTPDKIDACVPALRANDLLKLLDKYAGDLHEVRPSIVLGDGTKVRYPTHPYIGNHKGVFMREVARLKDGETQ